jgi:ATP/maltotriose-dependent transcriptional regulator MalT
MIFERHQGQDEMRHDHASALVAAAWAFGLLGQIDQADDFATRAHTLSREFDVRNGLRASHLVLGEIALKRGDLQHAAEHMKQWLTFFHQAGTKSFGTFGFAQIAMLAQLAGDWRCAARFAGFADAFWTRSQYPEASWLAGAWDFDIVPSKLALGESAFTDQFAAGQQLSDGEAFAEASSFIIAVQQRQAKNSILSRRELEVLQHISLGQTNQEIAAELFVGKSTIDTHVANILAKLGVETRWKAVNVARERGLL